MDSQLHNVNVVSKTDLPTPAEVKAALPLDAATEKSIIASRQVIRNIHDRRTGEVDVFQPLEPGQRGEIHD